MPEAAEAINEAAGERVVSGTCLWLLRTGQRDNPTMKHLIAIARFFGVPLAYFFPDDAMEHDAVPAELTAALSDDKVREMALLEVPVGLLDRPFPYEQDPPPPVGVEPGGQPGTSALPHHVT